MSQTNQTARCPKCGKIILQAAKACVHCGQSFVAQPVKQVNINIQGWPQKQLSTRDQKLTVIFGILFAIAFIFLSVVTTCAGPR